MADDLDPAKEWKRLVQTAQGFGKKHGHWPTRLVLPEDAYDALSEALSADDWAFLGREIQLRTGSTRMRAEDAEGDSYIWGESLATRLTFTVSDPPLAWFALQLDPGDAGGDAGMSPGSQDDESTPAVDPLSRVLTRLGYEPGDDEDPAESVERAIGRAGSAAVKKIRAAESALRPGAASAELFELIRVPRVGDILAHRRFRRVQMAVLRVHSAEFVAYFEERAESEGGLWSELSASAAIVEEALEQKPIPAHEIQAIRVVAETQSPDPESTTAFGALIEWVVALATDERHLTHV